MQPAATGGASLCEREAVRTDSEAKGGTGEVGDRGPDTQTQTGGSKSRREWGWVRTIHLLKTWLVL